jgi:hypothetical protein
MLSVHDETPNHDKRHCIDVSGEDDVDPPNGATAHVRDEKLLVVPGQDSGHGLFSEDAESPRATCGLCFGSFLCSREVFIYRSPRAGSLRG